MRIHLVDGTFELFRAYYSAPSKLNAKGQQVGATRGFLRSLWSLLQRPEVTHVGVAFDSVVESFRNDLFAGYKTGEGIEAELKTQFPLVERATQAMGVVSWPMDNEFECDDALASAAHVFQADPGVEQIVICSPDKDFAQCVIKNKVVFWDRIRDVVYDERGVQDKWGIAPSSMPDWLALVGDQADGIPGIPRWGAKSSSNVLSHYQHIENIPENHLDWQPKIRGAKALADNLAKGRDDLRLYKTLATLRKDCPLPEKIDALRWQGANQAALTDFCAEIDYTHFISRFDSWQS
jgi:5'-3' exonuclease